MKAVLDTVLVVSALVGLIYTYIVVICTIAVAGGNTMLALMLRYAAGPSASASNEQYTSLVIVPFLSAPGGGLVAVGIDRLSTSLRDSHEQHVGYWLFVTGTMWMFVGGFAALRYLYSSEKRTGREGITAVLYQARHGDGDLEAARAAVSKYREDTLRSLAGSRWRRVMFAIAFFTPWLWAVGEGAKVYVLTGILVAFLSFCGAGVRFSQGWALRSITSTMDGLDDELTRHYEAAAAKAAAANKSQSAAETSARATVVVKVVIEAFTTIDRHFRSPETIWTRIATPKVAAARRTLRLLAPSVGSAVDAACDALLAAKTGRAWGARLVNGYCAPPATVQHREAVERARASLREWLGVPEGDAAVTG